MGLFDGGCCVVADFGLVLLSLRAGLYGGGLDAFGTSAAAFPRVCILSPPSLRVLWFGGVFWVVSPDPNLSEPSANIINSYEMHL